MYTSEKTENDIIVIGGGAAGMLAALFAARTGAGVTLLEKNEKLGKKVYITGKGRCNVTNDCGDTDAFLREVPRNPRFLYSALRFFGPRDMMALLEELGCPVKTERGGRVFPVSDHASDVTRALEGGLRAQGVRVLLDTEVSSLTGGNGRVTGVCLRDGRTLRARAVIVCTGGLAYPATGSTGDGYRFAEALEIPVTPRSPSLTGLELKENWPAELSGLGLKNVALSAFRGKKKLFCEQGELLFTHYGISGPIVLDLSSVLSGQMLSEISLLLDLKPALTPDTLDARLCRELTANGPGELNRVLRSLMPSSLAERFAALAGVDGNGRCAQVSAETRRRLVSLLKAVPLTPLSLRPFREAVITRGGVEVKAVDPASMRARRTGGLYFAGEVLDVDAHTGGYNLQIAFSTGALAGAAAAAEVMENP